MKNTDGIKYYSPIEETINISSHAVGVILSIIALVLLIIRAETYRGLLPVVCFSIFGVSLIILYSASTLYHSAKKLEFRIKLKVFDHAAIYVLIAGTYTPLTLITIQGTIGWTIFIVSWVFAMIGITLKLFFTGRYSLISTLMYVLMGWIMIFAIKPLIHNLPLEGLLWFFGGGIAYTAGAVLYSIKKIKFNHAIFHMLALIGSFCHFITVFFYIIPVS